MKYLYCLKCQKGLGLETSKINSCDCGNVKGRFLNDIHAEICTDYPDLARFIGIHNKCPQIKEQFHTIDNEGIRRFEKNSKAHDWEEWENNIDNIGYSVVKIGFIQKGLHKRVKYNESLCEK